nr:hypothetical protein HmN_000776900 [Hymenolepis microstoma]
MEHSPRSQCPQESPYEINFQRTETPSWHGVSTDTRPPVRRLSVPSRRNTQPNNWLDSHINIPRIINTVRSTSRAQSSSGQTHWQEVTVGFIRPHNQCAMGSSTSKLSSPPHSSTLNPTVAPRPRIVEVRSWIQSDQAVFQPYRYVETQALRPQAQRSPEASHLNQPEISFCSRPIRPIRLTSGTLEQSPSVQTNWRGTSWIPNKVGLRFIRPPSHEALKREVDMNYCGHRCRRPISGTLMQTVQPNQIIPEPNVYTDMMLQDECVLRESPVRGRGRGPGRPPLHRSSTPLQLPFVEEVLPKEVSRTPFIIRRGRPPLSRISQKEGRTLPRRGPGRPPLHRSSTPLQIPFFEDDLRQELFRTSSTRRRGRSPLSGVNQDKCRTPSIRRCGRPPFSTSMDSQQPLRDENVSTDEIFGRRKVLAYSRLSFPTRLPFGDEDIQQELFQTTSIRSESPMLSGSLPIRLLPEEDFARTNVIETTSLKRRGRPSNPKLLSEDLLNMDENVSIRISAGEPIKRKHGRPPLSGQESTKELFVTSSRNFSKPPERLFLSPNLNPLPEKPSPSSQYTVENAAGRSCGGRANLPPNILKEKQNLKNDKEDTRLKDKIVGYEPNDRQVENNESSTMIKGEAIAEDAGEQITTYSSAGGTENHQKEEQELTVQVDEKIPN